MANEKISALSDGGVFQDGDEVVIVRSGLNFRSQWTNSPTFLNATVTNLLTVQTLVTTEDLEVIDQTITVNKGGNTASTIGAGILIEGDASAIVGYARTNGSDTALYEIKAPTGNVLTLNTTSDSSLNMDQDLTASDLARLRGTSLTNISGPITINADPTKIDIPSLTGIHVDNSNPDDVIVTNVVFPGVTGQTIDNLLTEPATFFSISSAGALIQSATDPRFDELRTNFSIGVAGHTNFTNVTSVDTFSKGINSNIALTMSDYFEAVGASEVKGESVAISANGANLKIDLSSGIFFDENANWINDKNNPNMITYAGATAPTFFYTWRDGAGGVNFSETSDILPGKYDDGTGGASSPNGTVSGVEFSNQFLFLSPSTGIIAILFAQSKHKSIIAAKNSRESDFNELVIQEAVNPLSFIGVISVRGDATDLSDITEVSFGRENSFDAFYDEITALGDGLIYDIDTEILVVANGTTTTVELQVTGGGNITVQLDGQSFIMPDDGSTNLISLTHGTDTVPTLNYVYIVLVSNVPTLTVSTTKPTVAGVGLFSNVKNYIVPSAATVQADGFSGSQQTINRFGDTNQSHIRHLDDIARESAQWINGVTQTMTLTAQGGGVDDLFIALTSGIVRQLHPHTWTSFSNGDPIYIANGFTTPYEKTTNLNVVDETTDGTTLRTNNRRYNLVIWGAQDEDGTDRKVYVNAPTGFYSSDQNAISDIDNTAVKSIPLDFKGIGFLIARIAVKYTTASNGTLEILQINGADFEDLREAGVGGGGATITQTEFSDSVFAIFNSTDPTKRIELSGSNIATGQTRTLDIAFDFTVSGVSAIDQDVRTIVSPSWIGATYNLPSDSGVLVDGATINRTITTGAYRQLHTPAIPGTRAHNYVIDINSQADTTGVVIEYTTTGLANGERGTGFQVDVDTANSTGGSINAFQVEKVGSGSAVVHALHAGVGVSPIDQESGTPGAVDTAFTYDDSLASFTDVTADFNSTGSDVQMFVEDDDIVYIGDDVKFGTVEFQLAISAANPGIKPIFEFWNGSAWTTFGPTDGTNGMRINGNIGWEANSLVGWALTTVNGSNKFWVRITRTTNSLSTPPTEDLVQVTIVQPYGWDENGDVTINNLIASSGVISGNLGISTGIVVGAEPATTPSEGEVWVVHPGGGRYVWEHNTATTTEAIWDILQLNTSLLFRTRSTNDTAGNTWLTVSRTGAAVNSITFTGTVSTTADLIVGSGVNAYQYINKDADGMGLHGQNWIRMYTGAGANNAFFYGRGTGVSNSMPQYTTNGTVSTTGGGGLLTVASDIRLKTNIQDSPYGLEHILQLRPVTYEIKTDMGKTRIGFLADDVMLAIPEAVDGKSIEYQWEFNQDGSPKIDENEELIFQTDEDGVKIPRYKGLDDRAIIASLVTGMQDQQILIGALTATENYHKGLIDIGRSDIDKLREDVNILMSA